MQAQDVGTAAQNVGMPVDAGSIYSGNKLIWFRRQIKNLGFATVINWADPCGTKPCGEKAQPRFFLVIHLRRSYTSPTNLPLGQDWETQNFNKGEPP
jgi:hypothetical protein